MRMKSFLLGTLLAGIFMLLALTMSGCQTINGFGKDISNAATTGEKLLNGEPIFYSDARQ